MVVKSTTIQIVLSLSLSKAWQIHQLDVKNSFLHGGLKQTTYMHQPLGFKDPNHPHHIFRLRKSLDGLKQDPRAWYKRFADYVYSIGFSQRKSNKSLFIYRKDTHMAYLLLYMDDIILTDSFDDLHKSIKTHHYTVALRMLSNASLSRDPTSHMRYNKYAFLCMTPWMITCTLFDTFCVTFKELVTTAYVTPQTAFRITD